MEFSTLMFLKEIQKSKYRRIRIKHLLLLLVRIAIIAFLVFAFADPFLKGYSAKSSNTKKLGIIFLDSSFSMLSSYDTTNLFQDAEAVASRIRNLYSSSDELITIITKVQVDTSNNNIPVKSNFNSILSKTNEILKDRNQNTSEIFILSDLQKVNFHNNLYQPNNFSNFYLIDVAENEKPNISISNINIDSKLLGISFPVKFKVTIRNHTDNFIPDEKLILYNNDVLLEERYFELKPNEIKQLEFSFTPETVKINTLKAELITSNKQLDAFKEDNLFFKRFYISENINIGIISEKPESAKYIKAVFDAANKNSQVNKVYDYKETSNLNNISEFDVVYLCGLKGFSDTDIESINKYSETGKCIIIFPSENINIDSYNKLIDIKITSLERINTDASIKDINTESPLFNDLFKTKKGETINGSTLEKISLESYYNITTSSESTVLLSLSIPNQNSQIPLIISTKPSAMRSSASALADELSAMHSSASALADQLTTCLLITVSSDLNMSSFPRHSLFAPFILRSSYISYSNLLPTIINSNLSTMRSSASALEDQLPANHDTLESNPEPINDAVLKTALDQTGIKNYNIISSDKLQSLENIITENRTGKSLWYIPLFIALALIPLEIFLSKRNNTK